MFFFIMTPCALIGLWLLCTLGYGKKCRTLCRNIIIDKLSKKLKHLNSSTLKHIEKLQQHFNILEGEKTSKLNSRYLRMWF